MNFDVEDFQAFRNDLAGEEVEKTDGDFGARSGDDRLAGGGRQRQMVDAQRRAESAACDRDFAELEGVAVADLIVEGLRDARAEPGDRDGPFSEIEQEKSTPQHGDDDEAGDRAYGAPRNPVEEFDLRADRALQEPRRPRLIFGERIFRITRPGARIFRVIYQTKRAFRERARAGKPIRTRIYVVCRNRRRQIGCADSRNKI